MVHYHVRFIKNLCDDTGHQHKCVEAIVDIRRAKDQARAIQAAKHRFERMKRIPRWDLYADSFELDIEEEVKRQN
jgi:hypothetical protein